MGSISCSNCGQLNSDSNVYNPREGYFLSLQALDKLDAAFHFSNKDTKVDLFSFISDWADEHLTCCVVNTVVNCR